MNVFVLCTGRCGSLTFTRACGHILNYSAGHETRCHHAGASRFAYPERHIEADNRLSWLLGRLDEAYGRDAFYVHLTRDPDAVAASMARRFGVPGGIAAAYRDAILMNATRRPRLSRRESMVDYVETVNVNIRAFLRDKPNRMHFRLERAESDFADFWERIGAEGPYDRAAAEWRVRHDTDEERTGRAARLREAGRRTLRAAFPPR